MRTLRSRPARDPETTARFDRGIALAVGAALISAMISSTLSSATARPSWMCAFSRALRSS